MSDEFELPVSVFYKVFLSSSPDVYIRAFKNRSKIFLKRFRLGYSREVNYLRDIGLPVDSPSFTFTLMNAQHVVAKINGFDNCKSLLEYYKLVNYEVFNG